MSIVVRERERERESEYKVCNTQTVLYAELYGTDWKSNTICLERFNEMDFTFAFNNKNFLNKKLI